MDLLKKVILLLILLILCNTSTGYALTLQEAKIQKDILKAMHTLIKTQAAPVAESSEEAQLTAIKSMLDQLGTNFTGLSPLNFDLNKVINNEKIKTKTIADLETIKKELLKANEFIETTSEDIFEKINDKIHKLEEISVTVSQLIDKNTNFESHSDKLGTFLAEISNSDEQRAAALNISQLNDLRGKLSETIDKLKDATTLPDELEQKEILLQIKGILPDLKDKMTQMVANEINQIDASGILKNAQKKLDEGSRTFFDSPWWGVGLTITMDIGSNDRVEDATIVNGIVRVNKDKNLIPRFMLETHYFFQPPNKNYGYGPFVAVVPGEDVVDAFGVGFMIGWQRGNGTESFNIGFGLVVDPNVQILGDGFQADAPPPAGETSVRFKETDQWGVFLVSSYSF